MERRQGCKGPIESIWTWTSLIKSLGLTLPFQDHVDIFHLVNKWIGFGTSYTCYRIFKPTQFDPLPPFLETNERLPFDYTGLVYTSQLQIKAKMSGAHNQCDEYM